MIVAPNSELWWIHTCSTSLNWSHSKLWLVNLPAITTAQPILFNGNLLILKLWPKIMVEAQIKNIKFTFISFFSPIFWALNYGGSVINKGKIYFCFLWNLSNFYSNILEIKLWWHRKKYTIYFRLLNFTLICLLNLFYWNLARKL